jgi:lipopolysaccharide transport system permease protein
LSTTERSWNGLAAAHRRTGGDAPVLTIRPSRGWRFVDLRELWSYRELVYFLTWRDLKVRYKQTVIGVGWAVLQPVTMTVVFTLFLGRLAGVPSDGVPYPLFVYVGLLPWQLFSRTITESTTSLVTDQRLITRVYFPRIIVPTSATLAGAVDFVIASSLLAGMMAYYRVAPTSRLLWVPLVLLFMFVTALGVGYWLSALNVEYRDVIYTMPFLNQVWLFATPVAYPSSLVPDRWQAVYGLNPMAGVIEGFRWAVLGTGSRPTGLLVTSGVVAVVLFLTGVAWFRYRERVFVDVIGSGGR